jgi:hypothetical protein
MALVHQLGWDARFMQRSPWFWPLARASQPLCSLPTWPRLADFDALHRTLTATTGVPALRFGPNVRKQDKRGRGGVVLDALYDARIALHGEVPTRDGDWHDLFNALCFMTFPRAKLALHQRQCAALKRRLEPQATALPPTRTSEQDALTLFDEGGVAVAADREATRALEQDTEPLANVLERLERAGHARVVPFGHALFEHLVEGLVCPGGGTRIIPIDPLPADDATLLDAVDQVLAGMLHDPSCFISPKEHMHLRFNAMPPPSRKVAQFTQGI